MNESITYVSVTILHFRGALDSGQYATDAKPGIHTVQTTQAATKRPISDTCRNEPGRAEPSRAEPSQAEPSRAEPSRAEPGRAGPSRADLSRAEPNRAEPNRAGHLTAVTDVLAE